MSLGLAPKLALVPSLAMDARLLLTPAVKLHSRIDVEGIARQVRSSTSVATPHLGAPIASFFTGLLGRKLLKLLSVLTMLGLRGGELPLSLWARVAGIFAVPAAVGGNLAEQLYLQLLADFSPERREQVRALLQEVERDQALLTQLTVESMDLFNAAAGDRDGVRYGSVVTGARQPGLSTSIEIGLDPVDQAQHALYYSLSRLAGGKRFHRQRVARQPVGGGLLIDFDRRALKKALGQIPDSTTNDGIVPTLSQLWGECIAVARADHLDIIGHYQDDDDEQHQYDWLTTHSDFRSGNFQAVWQSVVAFMAAAEAA